MKIFIKYDFFFFLTYTKKVRKTKCKLTYAALKMKWYFENALDVKQSYDFWGKRAGSSW